MQRRLTVALQLASRWGCIRCQTNPRHRSANVAQRRVRPYVPESVRPAFANLQLPAGTGSSSRWASRRSAETLATDGGYPKPLPFRFQHLIQIIFQIERNERQVARVFGERPINLQRRLAIALQNLARIAVNAGCLNGNVRVLIQQLAEWLTVRLPAPIRCADNSTTKTGAAKPVVSVTPRSLGPTPPGAYGIASACYQTLFVFPLAAAVLPPAGPLVFRPEPTFPATRPRLPAKACRGASVDVCFWRCWIGLNVRRSNGCQAR